MAWFPRVALFVAASTAFVASVTILPTSSVHAAIWDYGDGWNGSDHDWRDRRDDIDDWRARHDGWRHHEWSRGGPAYYPPPPPPLPGPFYAPPGYYGAPPPPPPPFPPRGYGPPPFPPY